MTVSEWNSNLEDIGENVIDALGWKAIDITNAIKQGAKTVGDLFDMQTLADVRAAKQADIDNIAITIPNLISKRDEKERIYIIAKERYQSLQHLCSGCNKLIDEAGQEGHRSLLCGNNHTYYKCNSQDKWLHTATFNCGGCGQSPLYCESQQHSPSSCGTCGATYYACSWGVCYFGSHPGLSVFGIPPGYYCTHSSHVFPYAMRPEVVLQVLSTPHHH